MLTTDPHFDREAAKYQEPIASREYIIEHLSATGRPTTWQQLCKSLALTTPSNQEALRRRLLAMVRDGQLYANRRGAYGLLAKMELITGYVVGHKDGFGFVSSDAGGEDLFINPRQMRLVFPGDRVVARIANIDLKGRREGLIVEVLEHNTSQVVGRFFVDAGAAYVQAVNKSIVHDIIIPADACGEARMGQIVVATIVAQPAQGKRPIGKITEIIGDHLAHGMEIDIALRNHDIPYLWPDSIASSVAALPKKVVMRDLPPSRLDLRHLAFVTIDGETAHDFDDAVYCEPLAAGGFCLYVAVADVSYYVAANSELDKEALKRGNSVYFPGRVIPMLPEFLANNLCSLKPRLPRLVMVCQMHISSTGQLSSYKFYEATIKSRARLTYQDVYDFHKGNTAAFQQNYTELGPAITKLFELYKVLRLARQQRGAIDFDLPETQIIFDEHGKIKEVIPLLRNEAHRLIEECMLVANSCAAAFLLQHKVPALYRNHETPSQEKINDLRRFVAEMGLKLASHHQPTPGDFAQILQDIQGRPEASLIQMMLLRSLSQAVYSPQNKGHFGLALDAYTHFTSPIRRYPDLLVHRAIRQVLTQQHDVSNESLVSQQKYSEHCSMTERRADNATREAVDWLRCEFMQDKVGEVFPGKISGVTGFGVFVVLDAIDVEGLIHISHLPNDYYKFDSQQLTLTGDRSQQCYRLGNKIVIQVARVDLDEGTIDFVVFEPDPKPARKARLKKHNTKRPKKPQRQQR